METGEKDRGVPFAMRDILTTERYFADPYSCEVDRKLLTDKYVEFFDLRLGRINWQPEANRLRLDCVNSGLFEPYVDEETQIEHVFSVLAVGYEERQRNSDDWSGTVEGVSAYLQKSRVFSNGNGSVPEKTREEHVRDMIVTGAALHDVIENNPPVASN